MLTWDVASRIGSLRPRLVDGGVDVWAARLPAAAPRDLRDASRELLSALLARYLDRDPRQLAFVRGAFGKPRLADLTGDGALQFSLSRGGDRCMVAVSRTGSIGVDVECLEPFEDIDAMAARSFSPAEATLIAAATGTERTRRFHECWTRREAYVKALGTGLNLPFTLFRLSLGDGNATSIVHPDGSDATGWSIHSLRPWDDAVAAVVVPRGSVEPELTLYHLDAQ
jgi:4'-phosphopantetheinyl transferase